MKVKKSFLIGTVVSVLIFLTAVVMTAYSSIVANEKVDLGIDLSGYSVTKMYTDNSSTRIIGTQEGELFAADPDGNIQWNVGRLYEQAVYEITMYGDDVYAVFANGRIVKFSRKTAEDWYASGDGESFLSECEQYYGGYNFDTSGNVRNTQLLISEDGSFFVLRGVFNDRRAKNRLYRFDAGEEGTELYRDSSVLGGADISGNDLYYSVKSELYRHSGGDSERIADLNETVVSLSVSEEYVYAVTENNNLFKVPKNGGEFSSVALSSSLNSSFVFSVDNGFVAKILNGGVAMIDAEKMEVTLTMNAADTANLVMWSSESFVLRDESDITNTQIIFYSTELAHRIALFSVLRYVFIAIAVAALVAGLYFGFGMFERFRRAINGKIVSFFKALNKYKLVYLSLLIPFVLLTIFYYIPIVFGFGLSFYDYVPGVKSVFVGMKNFTMVVKNPEFWSSALTMLEFLVADLLKALIPPIILAEAITAVKNQKFSLWVRILLFLPGILPGVATALVWKEGVFGATQNSLVNAFIGLFVPGFVKNWVSSASNATAVGTLIAFGFPWIGSYLIFFGAIAGINGSVFEAAKLDGCSWFKRIVKIDIPMILSQIKYIFVTSFIASVQNYTNILVVHGVDGQIKTPALLMYREIMNANYGIASVMGVLMFLFLSVATFVNFRMQADNS